MILFCDRCGRTGELVHDAVCVPCWEGARAGQPVQTAPVRDTKGHIVGKAYYTPTDLVIVSGGGAPFTVGDGTPLSRVPLPREPTGIRAEIERAQARIAEVPERARPKLLYPRR